MVIGIKGLQAQSDRMDTCQSSEGLSKKGKNVIRVAWSLDGIVRWVDRWSLELPELADR